MSQLSAAERDELFALMVRCYDGMDRTRFFRDLDAKTAVLLFVNPADGAVRGFSTVLLLEESLGGRTVDLIYSGDTVIDPAFWGSKALQRGFSRLCLVHKLKRPGRPLYWLLLSKGYKTYLLIARSFPVAVPTRHGESHVELRRLRDRVATASWGTAYDAERALLRFEEPRDRVKPDMAVVDEVTARDPDVGYFLAHNPGYARGDELVCLAELRARDLCRAFLRALLKPLMRRLPWRSKRPWLPV